MAFKTVDILLNTLWRVFDLSRRNFNESKGDNLEILGVLFDGSFFSIQGHVDLSEMKIQNVRSNCFDISSLS